MKFNFCRGEFWRGFLIADGEIFVKSCGIIFIVAKYILLMSVVLMAEEEQIFALNQSI